MDNTFEPKIVIDPFSLLVINVKGELRRIYCPFLARCMIPIDNLIPYQSYVVDMVLTETNTQIVYVIKGKAYAHHSFLIFV